MAHAETAGSVTRWIDGLQNGTASEDQQAIWDRYFQRMVAIARRKLPASVSRSVDGEDIALSALNSFFHAVKLGRYPDLRDRTELWPLLVRIVVCKAANSRDRELAQKRGAGRVRGDSALAASNAEGRNFGFDRVEASEPTPDDIVELRQLVQVMMESLESEMLRQIARLRLNGHSNREIAEHLNVSERTIERKLIRIRSRWSTLQSQ